jgi:hypothetical protein
VLAGYLALAERMCALHDPERAALYALAARALDHCLGKTPPKREEGPRAGVNLRRAAHYLGWLLGLTSGPAARTP